jgi:hypothetical protein
MKIKGLFRLFTSYLPMLGGFLRVLRLLPPLTLVAIHEIAEILLCIGQYEIDLDLRSCSILISLFLLNAVFLAEKQQRQIL